jgi:uncharacterized OsmC-like protein
MLLSKVIDFSKHVTIVSTPTGISTTLGVETGSGNLYFNPEDSLVAALASCISATISLYAKANNIALICLEGDLAYTMNETTPKMIKEISLNFKISGDFDEKQFDSIKNIAERCPIKNSLNPNIHFLQSFIWVKFKEE